MTLAEFILAHHLTHPYYVGDGIYAATASNGATFLITARGIGIHFLVVDQEILERSIRYAQTIQASFLSPASAGLPDGDSPAGEQGEDN